MIRQVGSQRRSDYDSKMNSVKFGISYGNSLQFQCKKLDFIAESFEIRANDRMLNLVRRNSGETYGHMRLYGH